MRLDVKDKESIKKNPKKGLEIVWLRIKCDKILLYGESLGFLFWSFFLFK